MPKAMYTANNCPKCEQFKRAIEQNGTEIEIINIDETPSAKEKLNKHNIMQVPVLEVDGEFITDLVRIFALINE